MLINYICVARVILSFLSIGVLHVFSVVLANGRGFLYFAFIIEKIIDSSNKDTLLGRIMWVNFYYFSELKIHNFFYTYVYIIIIYTYIILYILYVGLYA